MRALLLSVALLAAPTPTPYPTYTPLPTYTSAPTATATPQPTGTAQPTATPTLPPPPPSGPGGTPGSPCKKGEFGLGITLPIVGQEEICIPIGSLVGSIFQAVAEAFTAALSAIIAPFNAVLTITPDPTRWPDASSVFNYLWGVGIAFYGLTIVLSALHHYKRMMWAGMGASTGPLLMLSDAVQGAIFIGAAPWLLQTWFALVNALSASINGFVGIMGLSALGHLIGDVVAVATDPLLIVVDLVVSILMLIFMLLVGLIRLVGEFVLVWLYLLAPLCLACWVYPPLRSLTANWFRAFASVSLWGVGFAVALKVIAIMTLDLAGSDPAYSNPIIVALTGLAGGFFLFGVPRVVDILVGTSIAAASGSTAMAAGAISGVVTGATRFIGK